MKMLLEEASVGLIDEFCILCNVWLAGNVSQHTHGEKHLRWSEAAQAVFRQTAPAACVLAATLLRREVEGEVRGHYCSRCSQHVGGKFRQAIQHLDSRRHHRKEEKQTPLVSTVIKEASLHSEGFVQGVFCSICLCVVPVQQEKHLLSKRHQRNLRAAMSSASQTKAAEARQEMWVELLQPLHGNICCSCAAYVPVGDIMQHFTSERHKRAHTFAKGIKDKDGDKGLRGLLENAEEHTADRYCSVCDVTLRASMRTHHAQGKRHNMELLNAYRDPEGHIKLWRERFNTSLAKERGNSPNVGHTMPTVEVPSAPLDSLISVAPSSETPEKCPQESSGRSLLADMPLPFFFINGLCILCDCVVAPQSTGLVATPLSKEHCRTPKHKEALDAFVFQQREMGRVDAATAWAARWYEEAFGALREECASWRECAERLSLYTSDDFMKLLQDNLRTDAFVEAVCLLRTAS
ncbi:hypothetical protein MOQ_002327 [Trypanosoma cruzi marinkellei]|uniref:U1-type domain-containing protein n=1 Tax=Trypanosoma cruzi marinkellei TaxID=85056 RepID=K2MK86_TRYCR|nr:hypothetical protein MOQ_002327 [Trypanosoma cruzi marinkellei]